MPVRVACAGPGAVVRWAQTVARAPIGQPRASLPAGPSPVCKRKAHDKWDREIARLQRKLDELRDGSYRARKVGPHGTPDHKGHGDGPWEAANVRALVIVLVGVAEPITPDEHDAFHETTQRARG
jgi:hypothetical protein